MDKKQFPEQEENGFFPEETAQIPAGPEPADDVPVIEELTFGEDAPEPPAVPLPAEPAPEAPDPEVTADTGSTSPAEDTPTLSDIPAAEEQPVPPDAPAVTEPSFMDRIPDVEDAPESSDALTTPESTHDIQPNDHAMDSHGMLGHGEEEPPFDMSILDDPDLAIPEEFIEEIPDQEYRDNGRDFDEIFHAPTPEKKAPQPQAPRPSQKGRPKRKKGEGLFGIPNILATAVWLALIVAIGVTAGRMLWVCAADVLAFGREDKAVTITVYEADTMDDIIDKLYEGGLIRYKSLFKLYADISDAEEDIQPGIYDLNTRYDYHALVNFMSPRSSREVITLTIPEGYTCKQIFRLLEENRICTAVDAAAYAADGELEDYWFLEGVQRGTENCLEGYLFPDTYEFYKNSTPKEALSRMLNNFEIKFGDEMKAQLDTLNATLTGNYTVREIAIVASLIEKESAAPAESARVAGVIYNRLFNWGDTPKLLNIDAAIVYAQGGDAEHIDTSLDSPYNTYLNPGLPPTPIANPGLSSLQAALQPESHNYYYYVLNPETGMHQFSTTYEEHSAYVSQFATMEG